MRLGYLVPRCLLLAIVWAFFAFALDPLLKRTLVETGQVATGSRIDIDSFATQLYPPLADTGRVQIAHPGKPEVNLVEFAGLSCVLDGNALLRKKYVVDEARISGIRLGTARQNSGELDSTIAARAREWLAERSNIEVPEFEIDWIAGLSRGFDFKQDLDQFESVVLARQLKVDWKNRFESYDDRVDNLKQRSELLEDQVKDIDGNTLEKIEQYRRASLEVDRLLRDIHQLQAELPQLGPRAQQDLRDLNAARLRDQQRLRQKLEIFSLDPQKISQALLGPELTNRLKQTIVWADYIRRGIANVTEELEPERQRGYDVIFPSKYTIPGVLVRKVQLDGIVEFRDTTVPFLGTVADVSNDPQLLGRPIVVQIAAETPYQLSLAATIDRTTERAVDQVSVDCTIPEAFDRLFGETEGFALRWQAPQTFCRARLEMHDQELRGQLDILQANVQLSVETDEDDGNPLPQLVGGALAHFRELRAGVSVAGRPDDLQWQVQSNLGTALAQGLQTGLRSELERRQAELLGKYETRYTAEANEFSSVLNGGYRELTEKLKLNEEMTRGLLQNVAGNPLDPTNIKKLGGLKLFR